MGELAVAVTGPTGEIGISTVEALERDPAVERIVGMARRPFDPVAHGWTKTTYQQGDILDRKAVDALVAEGVRVGRRSETVIRLVTRFDGKDEDIDRFIEIARRASRLTNGG